MDDFAKPFFRSAWTKLSIPTLAIMGSVCLGGTSIGQTLKTDAVKTTEPVHRKVETVKLGSGVSIQDKETDRLETIAERPSPTKGGPQGDSNVPPVKPDNGSNSEKPLPEIPGRKAKLKKGHALDPAIQFAYDRLNFLEKNIKDYQGIIIKQERIGKKLMPAEYMRFKVVNRIDDGKTKTPLSVYMRFLKPSSVKGREVIWVEGKNNNKLIAHEADPFNIMTVHLDPNGIMAMRNNRYPITDFGIQNLIEKLIERASRDREHGDCQVEFFEDAKVGKRDCTMIQVKHDEQKAPFDFHIARIYIDSEYKIPIRYEAYTWPEEGSTKLPLLESYTYARLKFNTGLTGKDFDYKNEDYDFPN